ncbi:MAG: hypothetical protein R3298_03525 [Gammaproteobacteria bacterium]|nr:hypothetical protein [Gammaproteobacteria bacterium]
MIRKSLLTILLTLGLAGVALAGHCPKDAAAITAGLENSGADDATKAKVAALRDEGMELHNAGNHGASEDKMAEAMRLLLTN